MRRARAIAAPLALVLLVSAPPARAQPGRDRVGDLRVEYLSEPLGVDEDRPRLSWVLHSDRRGAGQSAYRIVVTRQPPRGSDEVVWDTGKVASGENTQHAYAGLALAPRTRYAVTVQLWDERDRPLPPASTWFETGKRDEAWQARWVGLRPAGDDERLPFVGAQWIWARPEQLDPARLPAAAGAPAPPARGPDAGAPPPPPRIRRVGFTATFHVPDAREVVEADLFVSTPGDGRNWVHETSNYLWVNGQAFRRWAAPNVDWRRIPIPHALRDGENRLHLLVPRFQDDVPVQAVLATVRLRLRDGRLRFVQSGPDWRVRTFLDAKVADDWIHEDASAAPWQAAVALAPFGQPVRPDDDTLVRLDHTLPPVHLRRAFSLRARPVRARLYATAAGVYEVELNGQRVGDRLLAPGWTQYEKRLHYQVYDVTALVTRGANVLGALVADGWFAGRTGIGRHLWGIERGFLGELHLDYPDGSREVIATDEQWRGATGAIRASDLLDGEEIDARRALPGWSRPDFDASAWRGVYHPAIPTGKLVVQPDPPVRRLRTLRVKAWTRPAPGVQVFDLGQNMVGWVRLVVSAPAGTRVTLRFGEVLDKAGRVYTESLRTALATDTFVTRGRGAEVFEPRFTFHGFRYVEITGLPQPLSPGAVQGVVIGSDLPEAGRWRSDSARLNQLQSNILWSQRGNYLSIPTDCPQRDERLGWTGDIQVFARAGAFNLDSAAFLSKYVDDLADAQFASGEVPHVAPAIAVLGGGGYAWGDALVLLPWLLHEVYGDTRVLARHWEAMRRWVDFRSARARDFLDTHWSFGDWLAPTETPHAVLGPIYHARVAWILAQTARLLGKVDEAARYGALFENIRAAFVRAHLDAEGRITADTQTAYALALRYAMFPQPEQAARAQAHLAAAIARADHRLATGFLGTGHLLPALSAGGQDALALRLLLTDSYPSWLYPLRLGATTMWERWDGYDPKVGPVNTNDMNSYNHYAFGAVGEWMYAKLGGIDLDPAEPGFRRVVIAPALAPAAAQGEPTRARAEYRSIRGPIAVAWRLSGGAGRQRLTLDAQVPTHARALLVLPGMATGAVREGGRPVQEVADVRRLPDEGADQRFELGPGRYSFSAELTVPPGPPR